MEVGHAPQVGAGENVGIKNPEGRFGFDPFAVSGERPGRAEQLLFADQTNLRRRVMLREIFFDCLGLGVHVDENVGNAGTRAKIEPNGKQRPATDGEKTFGDRIGKGT